MSADIVVVMTSLLVYLKYFYIQDLLPSQTFKENPGWYILLAVLWIVYSNAFKLYNTIYAPRIITMLKRTVLVAMVTGATYLLIPYLSPLFPNSRLPFFIFIGQTVLMMTIWHIIFGKYLNKPAIAKRVLIVGAGWAGKKIAQSLTDQTVVDRIGYEVIGFIDDDIEKGGYELEGIKVLSTSNDLFAYARRLRIDEIILAIHTAKSVNGKLYGHLVNCENYGITVTQVNLIYEEVTGMLMVKPNENGFALTYDYHSKPDEFIYVIVNRLINMFFGVVGLLICGISIPFVWYINALFSRGPLFYSQIRVGRDNQPYRIYKFRTMVVNAEKGTGAVWADKNDSRITGPGKFYRKTRIDELPQFWNVLKGDMNLIGPRPERPEIVDELVKSMPFFNTRHMVKPGITGWAQVRHKYGNTEEDSLIKLQYDLYYIKYRSFLLDISIIWQTITVMLKFKGN
tara:strand:+ start:11197 stop:12561 length:1365 start_codon:yes stop_codon:yes gene_type:complete